MEMCRKKKKNKQIEIKKIFVMEELKALEIYFLVIMGI